MTGRAVTYGVSPRDSMSDCATHNTLWQLTTAAMSPVDVNARSITAPTNGAQKLDLPVSHLTQPHCVSCTTWLLAPPARHIHYRYRNSVRRVAFGV